LQGYVKIEAMKLYNSLTRKVEDFSPLNTELVTMYACGPTVYDYAHIGNFRTYTLSDFINRILLFNGNRVKFIMNLTDVGHMTGDNLGDADTGEDRMEKSVAKEGRTAIEIANFYAQKFIQDYDKMNFIRPEKFTRATEYIEEQIRLVKILEEKGFTYTTSDGVYFDTSKFESYGQLSGYTTDNVMEGARVEVNPEKKHPTDFALWKLSPTNVKRSQEWASPWGIGFPGWHLECSAMSLAELGNTLDIHVGGEDLRMTHHQNEIAQSESATGKKFVRYWIHGAHMMVDGGRMGKSLGNAYTLTDIEKKGFDPMVLRYFFMTSQYRSKLNFTWDALQSAQNALRRLYELARGYKKDSSVKPSKEFIRKFGDKINDDLNLPEALAVVWEMIKSEMEEPEKLATLLKMDSVLGLKIEEHLAYDTPQKVLDVAKMRSEYRKAGIWDKADLARKQILEMGYEVEDLPDGKFKIKRKM